MIRFQLCASLRLMRCAVAMRFCCSLVALTSAISPCLSFSATVDASVTLKRGWNAVYVPVASSVSADETFADWPVPSVSVYSAQTFLSTRSTAGGITGESVTRAPFLIWTRDESASSTLASLAGDAVLVCCNTGNVDYVARLRGTPSAPRIAWHVSSTSGDTLNYVGISLNPGVAVNASAYFAGCPSVSGGTFYRLSGTEDSPKVTSLAGISSTSSARLSDGMAVLVPGVSVSEWAGPLHVSPRDGIAFGETRTTGEVAIRNDGAVEKSVSLELVPSSDGADMPPLLVRDAGDALVNPDWQPLPAGGTAVSRTLATGETWRVSIALDRSKLAGTGAELGAILRISETGGTQMRVSLPVTARDAKDANVWPCGLWAIDLELDRVSRYVTDTDRVDGLKAGGKMRLRVYAHVSADGVTRLLPRVTVAGAKRADGSITRTAYGPQAALPTGLDYARRLTSAALPADASSIAPTGGAKWGGRMSFEYRIAATSASNPFRHPLHPMFDGKDANFAPLPYDGDDFRNYANAVKPELFSIGGEVVLDFGASSGASWSPQETVSGSCDWVYTGLMRQGPVRASGRFTAQRVVAGVSLVE